MTGVRRVEHEFVEFVPNELAEATLYISMPYATAVHLCLCGCGNRVVTPLAPVHWSLTFDGETVTLDDSIGNWSFPCQSHYFIRRSRVVWAERWPRDVIAAVRARDRARIAAYYGEDEHDATRLASSRGPSQCWHRLLPARIRRWLGR